jgi:hypothetical protein
MLCGVFSSGGGRCFEHGGLRDYMLHWFAVNKRKGGNIHLSLESLYRFTLRQSPGVSYTAETVPHSETERTSMAIYEALPIF